MALATISTIGWPCRISLLAGSDRLPSLRWRAHVEAKDWKDTAPGWCTMMPLCLCFFPYSSSFSHFSHTLCQITRQAWANARDCLSIWDWPLIVIPRCPVKFPSSLLAIHAWSMAGAYVWSHPNETNSWKAAGLDMLRSLARSYHTYWWSPFNLHFSKRRLSELWR